MRTAAIIPARDEEPTVGTVVRVVRASPLVDEIIVVDGGSRDDTRGRAEAAERGWSVAAFVCTGMTHRTKEEKAQTPIAGWVAKVRMLATAAGSYAGYRATAAGVRRRSGTSRPTPRRKP